MNITSVAVLMFWLYTYGAWWFSLDEFPSWAVITAKNLTVVCKNVTMKWNRKFHIKNGLKWKCYSLFYLKELLKRLERIFSALFLSTHIAIYISIDIYCDIYFYRHVLRYIFLSTYIAIYISQYMLWRENNQPIKTHDSFLLANESFWICNVRI